MARQCIYSSAQRHQKCNGRNFVLKIYPHKLRDAGIQIYSTANPQVVLCGEIIKPQHIVFEEIKKKSAVETMKQMWNCMGLTLDRNRVLRKNVDKIYEKLIWEWILDETPINNYPRRKIF